MKNIFLLPTNKPSRVFITKSEGLGFDNQMLENTELDCQNQNIYITSQENLTLGGYHFNSKYGDEPQKTNQRDIDSRKHWEEEDYCISKIILTTDQDLIKDGVQKIDDDFLQWFVTNSDCELVETKRVRKEYVDDQDAYGYDVDYYKIIIPKKNFYCGDEVDHGEKCEFQCEGCNDATGVDYGFLPQEKELYCRNGLCDGKGECDYNGCQCQGERLKIQQEKTLDNIISEKMLEKADVIVTLHKGTVLTTEEVMKERSSAYEFMDFENKINLEKLQFPELVKELSEYYKDVPVVEKEERLYTKEDMLEAFNAGNKRGHSGYPNTDNWTQPTFEDFISAKNLKTR